MTIKCDIQLLVESAPTIAHATKADTSTIVEMGFNARRTGLCPQHRALGFIHTLIWGMAKCCVGHMATGCVQLHEASHGDGQVQPPEV
jgi:hypothetical protein